MDTIHPQVRHIGNPTHKWVQHDGVGVGLRLALRLGGGVVEVVLPSGPLLKGVDLSPGQAVTPPQHTCVCVGVGVGVRARLL